MPFITAADGVEIFFKDWGDGQPVVFSHGWPLSSDSWESQQLHLASNGFRAGGGEVARYLGRHGSGRVAKAALVSSVPPFMLRTDDNPGGVPIDVFDGLRAGSLADRSQLYHDLADGPFFGSNRDGVEIARGPRDAFWRQGMQAGHKNAYESIAAFSATDFRADLEKFDVPTLVIHGDDDQVVPYEVGGKASAARIPGAQLITYEGGPHGITDTHKQR